MTRVRRVHHPDVGESGGEIELDREESKHLVRVLRLRPGDAVGVFDGRGREWRGVIRSVDESLARVEVGDEITTPADPAVEVELYQALCRPDRMEWVIQKATEVGASAVRCLRTERVELAPPSPSRLARWQRIALEACKQCGRRRIPEITSVPGLPGAPEGGRVAIVLETGAGVRPLAELLGGEPAAAVSIVVGPEGGLSDGETDGLVRSGWSPAGLGPRTFRTETAGVVAATLVLHAWGDLGRNIGTP